MPTLSLDVFGHGPRTVEITHVYNAGYAGRDTAQVQAHVDELALLGVPAPSRIPTLYPLSSNLASQATAIQVPHAKTSGEAEWAVMVTDDGVFIAAACDHTDRALETHGVAPSKQSAPDLVGRQAWLLSDVADELDQFTLKAWVSHQGNEELIQDGTLAQLLAPSYWIDQMEQAGLIHPGVMVMSGTIPMIAGIDQFADGWRVQLASPRGEASEVTYTVERLAEPWE